MEWLLKWSPYILAVSGLIANLIGLVKDWREHRTRWLRVSLLVVLVLSAVLTAMGLYQSNDDMTKLQTKADALQTKADTAISLERDNAKLFTTQFANLSHTVADLQTKVATEALQKELTSVQTELQNTRIALQPGPKAVLTFTFVPYQDEIKHFAPTSHADLKASADGRVHVDFALVNMTEVDALNVDVTLKIGHGCTFADDEPKGFQHIKGTLENQRFAHVAQIAAQSSLYLSTNVIPPHGDLGFEIGVVYRCHQCVLTNTATAGTVRISRR